LVLDLDDDGLELIDRDDSYAFFDYELDGYAMLTGWVAADDGFLALDQNADGAINDVSELFGANPTTVHGAPIFTANGSGFLTR
jgi:hypothetical protein